MNKKIKLNLQFFAENEQQTTDLDPQSKTYTEEEYMKLKNSFDKTSKELAEMKKQEKEKLPEKEKEAKEREELKNKLDEYEREIENNKIEKLFLKNGFNAEETEKIIKARQNEDFLSTVLNVFNTKLENEKKKWQEELINKTKGVSGVNSNNEESYAIRKAKERKEEKPIKWGNF